MFQIAINNTRDRYILTLPFYAGRQAADTADQQLNFYPGLLASYNLLIMSLSCRLFSLMMISAGFPSFAFSISWSINY